MGEQNGPVVVPMTEEKKQMRVSPSEAKKIIRMHEDRTECQAIIIAATLSIDDATERRNEASIKLRQLGPQIEGAEKAILERFGLTGPYTLTPDGLVIPQG